MSNSTSYQDIYREVVLSVSQDGNAYDAEGITKEIIQQFDLIGEHPQDTFDSIDEDTYWSIVEKHEISKVSTPLGSFRYFTNNQPLFDEPLPDLDEVELLDYIDHINATLEKERIYLSTDGLFYSVGTIADDYKHLIRAAIIKADDELI